MARPLSKKHLNPFTDGDRIYYIPRAKDARRVPGTVIRRHDEAHVSVRLDYPVVITSGRLTRASVVSIRQLERIGAEHG